MYGHSLGWRHMNVMAYGLFANSLLSWKETPKLRIDCLSQGNPLMTGGFPAQSASYKESASISCRRDVTQLLSASVPINWDNYHYAIDIIVRNYNYVT